MTRKSRREIERDVGKLAEDGRTLNRETSITRSLVMSRERAEREGREILGPADVAAAGDFVQVNPES